MRTVTALGVAFLIALAGGLAQEQRHRDQGHDRHHGDMAKEMRSMNDRMVQHLGKTDADYEKRFIDMMIPHHEGAIKMARHALQYANRPELKEMAKKMIEDQEKEIAKMKEWRKEWYASER